jgi:hypothetical protein
MKKLMTSVAVAATMLFAGAAQAAPVPVYSPAGVANPITYTFTAQNTGSIVAYFAYSNAAYRNEIGLLVNGVSTGIQGLDTRNSAPGTMLNLGPVNAGDSLVFVLYNLEPGNIGAPWYSEVSRNSDGLNHVYSVPFSGDLYGTVNVPAGVFVAFEDKNRIDTDYDYNDEAFVFTNVAATNVPEPASVAMLAMGLGLMGAVRRKSRKSRK